MQCATCAKKTREEEINKIILEKGKEIQLLKQKVLENEIIYPNDLYAKIESMEKSILGKFEALEKTVNNIKTSKQAGSIDNNGNQKNQNKWQHWQQSTSPMTDSTEQHRTQKSTEKPGSSGVAFVNVSHGDGNVVGVACNTDEHNHRANRLSRPNLEKEEHQFEHNQQSSNLEGFETFLSKRRKQQIQRQKKGLKVGERDENNEFESSQNKEKKIWLFLSKVKSDITEQVVKSHITKHSKASAEDVQVKLCTPKQQKGNKKCFMVGVNPDLMEMVYDTKFWPRGVAFERFNFAMGKIFLEKTPGQNLPSPVL